MSMLSLVARRATRAVSMVRALPALSNGFRFQGLSTETSSKTAPADATPAGKVASNWVGLTNDQDFFAKNEKLQRPMSPHIFIYRFPLPAVLSVTHRATGIMLASYICTAGIAVGLNPLDFYIDAIQSLHLSAPTIAFGKFALAFPMAYHTANGIRHLIWDTAKQLSLKELYTSGYFTLGLSAATAGVLAVL